MRAVFDGSAAAQGINDESHGRRGDFDFGAGDSVLGVAPERGETGAEFGSVAVSPVEDRVFAGERGLEFYKGGGERDAARRERWRCRGEREG